MPTQQNVWKDDRAYDLGVRLRQLSGGDWQPELEPYLDETVEISIAYQNTSYFQQVQTTIRYDLPDGLEVVPESVRLFNASYPDGQVLNEQELLGEGLDIGDYGPQMQAELRFQVRPIPRFFAKRTGVCTLFGYAHAQVKGASMQKYARNIIYLKCRKAPQITVSPSQT